MRRLWNFIHAGRPFLLDEKAGGKLFISCCGDGAFVSCSSPLSHVVSSRLEKQTRIKIGAGRRNRRPKGVSKSLADFGRFYWNWQTRKLNIPPPQLRHLVHGRWSLAFIFLKFKK